ncbi:hypothetical protein [Bartonella queenslandensis]|uniref:hypothetical protein n=1 Tax=Bartonella queenslandensis TaxID=481138 RepID=UPI001BA4445F|nr:hypothetical protein [Bartonella queenslandensis]
MKQKMLYAVGFACTVKQLQGSDWWKRLKKCDCVQIGVERASFFKGERVKNISGKIG